MLKSNEIKQLDKEIIELEKLVSETMIENEIIKLNIKKKELLLKKYQLLDVKGYRIYYRVIGLVIAVIGCILTPFIPKLISGEVPDGINIYIL